MNKKKLLPLLGLAIFILGYPAGLVIGALTPNAQAADLYYNLRLAAIFLLIPSLGGVLVAVKWHLWAILAAPLYLISAYVWEVMIFASIFRMNNPDISVTDPRYIFWGETVGFALLFASVGSVAAGFSSLVTTIVLRVVHRIHSKERAAIVAQGHGS